MSVIKELTKKYIKAFDSKDIDQVGQLFHEDFVLEDPAVKRLEGKTTSLEAVKNIFSSCEKLCFKSKNIYIQGDTSLIEFELKLDDVQLKGIDIIEWQDGKMKELRAYLDMPK